MSDLKARTPHGEVSIDQLAEIQPGMGTIMKVVGERFTETYYAAKGGNWKLAAHHLSEIRVQFRIAKVTRPKFADDLAAFDQEYLQPIFKAIRDQNWAEFEMTFRKGEGGSDVYHDKRGYPHIRYVLPKEPPSDLYQGPPDQFKRESQTSG
jgi:hypothetical protein